MLPSRSPVSACICRPRSRPAFETNPESTTLRPSRVLALAALRVAAALLPTLRCFPVANLTPHQVRKEPPQTSKPDAQARPRQNAPRPASAVGSGSEREQPARHRRGS